jgi:poly(hydroxyalkanoate) depolymerase family esterase
VKESFLSAMNEVKQLVLSRRLGAATALVQSRLGIPAEPSEREPSQAPHFEEAQRKLAAGLADLRPRSGHQGAPLRSRPRFPAPGSLVRPASARRAPPLPPGAAFLHHVHAGAAGRRAYRLYVPAATLEGPRPLIVMLHGCTQDPEDFALGTRMNAYAEVGNFLVAYPEQDGTANASRCWNWFEPAHQGRGAGEPAILAAIVADIAARLPVDRSQVFVAGLSAGGAMAAVLGASYPDVFAAIGVHSGLAAGSASDIMSALSVMRSGKSTARLDRDVRRGSPRAIVFHGAKDRTVHPANGARVAGLDGSTRSYAKVDSGTVDGRSYTRTVLRDSIGIPTVEHWQVDGLEHAWSGGDPEGSYADPCGPDASREMIRFFLRPRDR